MPDNKDMVVKFFRGKVKSIDEATHSAEVVISSEVKDRYRERVLLSAFNKKTIKEYMEHNVLLSSHAYRGLMNQIGEIQKISPDEETREVIAKPAWFVGLGNPESDWGWVLAQKGIAAFSIGFRPKTTKEYSADETAKNGGIYCDYEDIELLEVSQVLVPANPSALQKSFDSETDPIAKDYYEEILKLSSELREAEELEVEERGVIPYKKHSLAPKDTPWNKGPEVKAADVKDLLEMSAFFDGDGSIKNQFKLPHHTQKGYNTVWHGVANAAARLPQSNISEKVGVQKHLGGHYKDFDETPPWGKKKEWEEYCDLCERFFGIGEITNISPEDFLRLKTLFVEFFPEFDIDTFLCGLEDFEDVEEKAWEDKPNEIWHGIKDASGYDKTRRIPIQKKNPRVFALYGRLKADTKTWEIYALRFPKADGWTMDKAKAWVKDHPKIGKDFSDEEQSYFFSEDSVNDFLNEQEEYLDTILSNVTEALVERIIEVIQAKKVVIPEKLEVTEEEMSEEEITRSVAELRASLFGKEPDDADIVKQLFTNIMVEAKEKFAVQSQRQ